MEMFTQTLERQELQRVIDTLPDDRVIAVLDYAKNYCPHIPNAETREAIAELRAGKGKKFTSLEALMADLHDESDD
jgi:hypothetical protein